MNANIEKNKKMLLVLPSLVVPFAIMLFWALGGGKSAAQTTGDHVAGLNTQVPGAHLKKDSAENKLTLYEQAEKDSLKFDEARKDDPYYHADSDSVKQPITSTASIIPKGYGSLGGMPAGFANTSRSQLDENERQITMKLAEINKQINQPAPQVSQADNYTGGNISEEQLSRLQSQLQQAGNNKPDPQLQQLSDMLDKIADVENPGVAREKLKEESEKKRGQVFSIATSKPENTVSTLDNNSGDGIVNAGNGFYSFDEPAAEADSQNTVGAVIAATQTLVNGSTVKLRLTNDIYINGTLIPQNTFVYGIAGLSGERLEIKISNIRYKKSLYPVSLSVFDLDGLDGVYIPGAITRDVAKESADQSIQNLGMMSYDPSLGAQAATAGITAAKTLFSRKVRLIKVTVKAGYQVLLRDEKQKQNIQ